VEFRSPRQVRETIDRALHRGRDLLGIPDPLWRRRREWVADDDAWPTHSVLVHADLHPGHTLVSGGELVGVIDWTDIVVGDPAADFRRIGPGFGPERLSDVLDAYLRHGGPTWPGMRRHIAERAAMAPVSSGLSGVDSGQDRYVDAARERFANWSPGTGTG
jgi:macrolide phosphotransferase